MSKFSLLCSEIRDDCVRFSRRINGLLALVAAALVAGCGVSQELYSARTTELDRCQSELARTRTQMSTTRDKSEELAAEAAALRDRIAALEGDRAKLASNLSATQKEMDELRRAHTQAEQRSELYRTLVTKLRSMIDAQTLGVEIRKGKMVVKLGDQILFDPGRAELKTAGAAALRQVAAVLREIPDRDFLVAGHTDNRPIRASTYRSNWELSTARAVTVVQFLQTEGVDPRRLAAAGYSEFDPLSDNIATDTRAQNRRIEVVVMPKSEELPTIDPSLSTRPSPGPTDSGEAPALPMPKLTPLPSPAPPLS
jgi:chemotaxis protein MotB